MGVRTIITQLEGHLPLVLAAAVILPTTYLIYSVLRQYYRLGHIPGPRAAGFTRLWLARTAASGRTHLDLYEASQAHDRPFTRVAPDEVIVTDPKFMRHMLHVRSPYQKSGWYYALRFDPTRDNVISLMDDDAHTLYRAKMAAGYSGRAVDNLEPRVDCNVLALMDLLDQRYVAQGRAFDFARKASYFTLDVISDVAFGDAFGFLAGDEDKYDYIAMMEKAMPSLALSTVYPWLVDLAASPVMRWLLPSAEDKVGFGKLMGIAKMTAAKRFGPDKKVQNDMLGSFIANGLNQEDVESEILVQVVAGADTTSTAIRATVLHIISNPRVEQKLYSELQAAGVTSLPWNSIISDAKARKLPYLQAVIKEGLRIFPPAVGLGSKVVPPEGDTYQGIYLPGGTKIGYCGWGIFRRRDVWGDDAAEFRPERWLASETEPEKLREMEATLDLAFGGGRWQCLGRNVALMELNKAFAELIRRFHLGVADPTQTWKSVNVGIFMQSELYITGHRR